MQTAIELSGLHRDIHGSLGAWLEIVEDGDRLAEDDSGALQHLRGRILHRALQPAVNKTEVGLDQRHGHRRFGPDRAQ